MGHVLDRSAEGLPSLPKRCLPGIVSDRRQVTEGILHPAKVRTAHQQPVSAAQGERLLGEHGELPGERGELLGTLCCRCDRARGGG